MHDPPAGVPWSTLGGASGTLLSSVWISSGRIERSAPAANGITWTGPHPLPERPVLRLGTNVLPARARVTWYADGGPKAEPDEQFATAECDAVNTSAGCAFRTGDSAIEVVLAPPVDASTVVVVVVTVAWYIPSDLHARMALDSPEVRATWGWRMVTS